MLIVGFHLLAQHLAPQPLARPNLRHKVMALTHQDRPGVILAGDSRAMCGLMPDVVAEGIGVPLSGVINIGVAAADTAAVLAMYREFGNRFAPRPVLIAEVSIFAANDSAYVSIGGDEVLWTASWAERLRLAPLGRACVACFLPDKALCLRMGDWLPLYDHRFRERGFHNSQGSKCLNLSPNKLKKRIKAVDEWWFADPQLDGLRWQRMEADLQELHEAGVQVVVLDPPYHPAFVQATAGTRSSEAARQFRRQLAALCARLNTPLLSYDPDCFAGPPGPETLFADVVHLNRVGARAFSQIVARDIKELIGAGRLQFPAECGP